MKKILLVEDKESLARMITEALETEGFQVQWSASGSEAIRALSTSGGFGLVLTDLRLPGADGIEVLKASREQDADRPVIVMTAYGTIEEAVEAIKGGAYDFIQKPVDLDYLLLLIRRALEHRALRSENLLLREEYQRTRGLPLIIGDSPPMRDVTQQIQKVAQTDSTVLLLGESGTGKELFARAIHSLSSRAGRPFVAINCAAIPETLIENELFGHEKGAYTGAGSRQIGKFELADGGTVFLDEIGELPAAMQAKILRVLQERSFERVGGLHPIEVDIRIICATNRNLEEAVREGRFRDDLFFRIHVFPVVVPPLRARKEDLDPLVRYFVRCFASEMGKGEIGVSEEAWTLLRAYDWPGNIRELENALERAVILADGSEIGAVDLRLPGNASGDERLRETFDLSGSLDEVSSRLIARVERAKILEALRDAPDRHAAAERLGLSIRALTAKLRLYGLEEEQR